MPFGIGKAMVSGMRWFKRKLEPYAGMTKGWPLIEGGVERTIPPSGNIQLYEAVAVIPKGRGSAVSRVRA